MCEKKKTPPEVGLGGADNGTRTRGLNLGKVALYQLSYVRMFSAVLLPEHEYLLYPHSQNLQVRVSCSCFAVPSTAWEWGWLRHLYW